MNESADECQDGVTGGANFKHLNGSKDLGERKLSTYAVPPLILISDSINLILQWMWKRQVPGKYRKYDRIGLI